MKKKPKKMTLRPDHERKPVATERALAAWHVVERQRATGRSSFA